MYINVLLFCLVIFINLPNKEYVPCITLLHIYIYNITIYITINIFIVIVSDNKTITFFK